MPPQEQTTFQDMSGQHDPSRYSLSVEEASSLFINAGVPRSPRTVIRYCSQEHLNCIKVDTERNEKYLVSQESVNARIEELKQIPASGYVALQRDVSGRVKTSHDVSGHNETRQDTATKEEKGEIERKIKSLESEMFDLKITNRAKDMFIDQLKAERENFVQQLMTHSKRIGELETKLLQLEAPKQDPPRRMDEPKDAEFSEIEEQPEEPMPSEQRL